MNHVRIWTTPGRKTISSAPPSTHTHTHTGLFEGNPEGGVCVQHKGPSQEHVGTKTRISALQRGQFVCLAS